MKQIICLLIPLVLLFGCSDRDDGVSLDGKGRVEGRIVDKFTGETISDAYLSLQYQTGNIDKATLNCDNGYYIMEGETGTYVLKVTRLEYEDLVDTVTITSGVKMKRDLPVEKKSLRLTIVNDKRDTIKVLDFGKFVQTKMFNIFNDGTLVLDWWITKDNDWITKISPDKGDKLERNAPQAITVTIDPNKLIPGLNVGKILINSNNGHKALIVSAYGEYIEPKVDILPLDKLYSRDRLNAKIITIGKPAYTDKGFCYSTDKKKPTIDDISLVYNENEYWHRQTGDTYSIGDLYFNNWDKTTYHFRAWIKWKNENGKDTIIYSENVETLK